MTKHIVKLNIVQYRRISNRKLAGRKRSILARINKTKKIPELIKLDKELIRVRKEQIRRKKK